MLPGQVGKRSRSRVLGSYTLMVVNNFVRRNRRGNYAGGDYVSALGLRRCGMAVYCITIPR